MLGPGTGKTKTGRLWTYVRDDRPAGDHAAPTVWFAYSADRGGEHPAQHLKTFQGALQADAYAGFNQLYKDDRIQEIACWAHYPESGIIQSESIWSCVEMGESFVSIVIIPTQLPQ